MNQASIRARSALGGTRSVRAGVSLGLLVSLTIPAAAQTPRLVVSTTDDLAPAVGLPFPVTDGELLAVQANEVPVPYLAGGHFQATTGFQPGDIDGYARRPGSTPGRASGIVFSLLSNEGGFLDGDLITLDSGGAGAVLLVSELDLATALGAPGANIDVDALTYDDTGRVLFSLAADLAGSALGVIQDGDVLRLEPGFAGVTRILTEAEVQARFTLATGLSDAILDVQALEWAGGELWAAVQSPSRHDGSVLALEGTPYVVADENDLNLGGAELDSLASMRPGDELPVVHMGPDPAAPGDLLHIETRGVPGGILLVMMCGGAGFVPFPGYPGFGGWYVDPADPWLSSRFAAQAIRLVALDGNGRFSADWALPAGMEAGLGLAGELGWSFQLMDVGTRQISAPFRVRRL